MQQRLRPRTVGCAVDDDTADPLGPQLLGQRREPSGGNPMMASTFPVREQPCGFVHGRRGAWSRRRATWRARRVAPQRQTTTGFSTAGRDRMKGLYRDGEPCADHGLRFRSCPTSSQANRGSTTGARREKSASYLAHRPTKRLNPRSRKAAQRRQEARPALCSVPRRLRSIHRDRARSDADRDTQR